MAISLHRARALAGFVLIVVVIGGAATFTRILAPADTLQSNPLFRNTPDTYRIENPLLTDVTHVVVPWLALNKDAVRSAKLPIWNEYEGNGSPHLANPQTAVFSIFSLPIYLFGFQHGLTLAAMLKLIVAFLGMYRLARRWNLPSTACLLGATVFTFSGYLLVWLNWPMVGTAALAPWLLDAYGSMATQPRWRPRIIAAILTALVFFSGHPETGIFVIGLAIIYGLIVAGRARIVPFLSSLVLVAIGTAALTAIQLLPFLEYLENSWALQNREASRSFFSDLDFGLLALFPGSLGTPAASFISEKIRLFPNYNELMGSYIAPVAIALAAVAVILYSRRAALERRLILSFAVIALAWTAIWYDFLDVGTRLSTFGPVTVLAFNRGHVLWLLPVALLASFGLSDLLVGKVPAWLRGFISGLAVVYLLMATASMAVALAANDRSQFRVVSQRILMATLIGLAGLGLLYLLARSSSRDNDARSSAAGARSLVILGVFLVAAVQTAGAFTGYNPGIREEQFFPRTPSLDLLSNTIGDAQVLTIGSVTVPPNVLSYYGIRTPFLYDAINLESHRDLVGRLGDGTPEFFGVFTPTSGASLLTLGVEYVATARAELPWSVTIGEPNLNPGDRVAFDPGAETAVFLEASLPSPTSCSAIIDAIGLEDASCLGRSDGMAFTLSAAAAPFEVTNPFSTSLMVKVATGPVLLDPVADNGTITIYQVPGASASLQSECGNLLAPSGVCSEPSQALRVVSESSSVGRWMAPDDEYVVEAEQSGLAWRPVNVYPGWEVSVDGEPATLETAFSSFQAVEVPAGRHVVRFQFNPRSVQMGAVVSVASWLAALSYLAWTALPGLGVRWTRMRGPRQAKGQDSSDST